MLLINITEGRRKDPEKAEYHNASNITGAVEAVMVKTNKRRREQ
jgi:hypothetical protein